MYMCTYTYMYIYMYIRVHYKRFEGFMGRSVMTASFTKH